MWQNVPYMLFFAIFQLVIRDKPETPPSAVAAAPPSELTFCEAFKEMWANKNFMLLALAYALIYGVYGAVGGTMSNLLNPFGYQPTQISVAGGICLLTGVAGALSIGCFLDYTAKYRATTIVLSFTALLAVALLATALSVGDDASLGKILAPTLLSGAACVSFFPTGLGYGAELTFPLAPALVNACMNFLGQLSALLLGGASTFITDVDAEEDLLDPESIARRQSHAITAMGLLGVCCLAAMGLSICVRQELRRLNYDHGQEDNYVHPPNQDQQKQLNSIQVDGEYPSETPISQ